MTQAIINVELCRRWVRSQQSQVVEKIALLGARRGLASDGELTALIAAAEAYVDVLGYGDEQFMEAFLAHGWDVTSEDGTVRLTGVEYSHLRPALAAVGR